MELTETQTTVLRLAANHASLHGLNDLTIGQLATMAGMSKAGLHGAFGSKEDLQMMTIRFAASIFAEEVITPALKIDSGRERVRNFVRGWLSYVDRKVFPGGCFFGRVSMEGGSLSDQVNTEIRKSFQSFRRLLSSEIARTKISASLDPKTLADQLLALVVSYNWAVHSLHQAESGKNIRSLIEEKLKQLN